MVMVLQLAILLLSFTLVLSLLKLPKKALTINLRSKSPRSTAQAHRHFILSAQLLSRAQSQKANPNSSHKLAKESIAQSDLAICLNPKDAGAHIIKALALDIIGHKAAALRSMETALVPPLGRLLQGKERGDALLKRAELKCGLNRRRQVDSAVVDLVESVRLSPGNGKGFCLLGQCYESKGLREEAEKAFLQALKVEPNLSAAREGLGRLARLGQL